MSHFTVLVIGNDPEKQLQPYHEYECTGIEDEHVVDVDKSDEVKEWLAKEIWVGFSKKENKLDYEYHEDRARENLTDPEKMSQELYIRKAGKDMDAEISDYHGYEKRGDKWIRHTNPNSKWDWYSLGGRWTGFFKMKDSVSLYKVGQPGLMTEEAEEGCADQAYKKDIDFDYKRNKAAIKASEDYDYATKVFGDLPLNQPWNIIRERQKSPDEARKEYWAQPRCIAWSDHEGVKDRFGYHDSPDSFIISKDEYIAKARNSAGVPFAVVKDSEWYEKGQMGWWAMVSNEMDQEEWNTQFWKMIDEMPDDTLLSLYDCHI